MIDTFRPWSPRASLLPWKWSLSRDRGYILLVPINQYPAGHLAEIEALCVGRKKRRRDEGEERRRQRNGGEQDEKPAAAEAHPHRNEDQVHCGPPHTRARAHPGVVHRPPDFLLKSHVCQTLCNLPPQEQNESL